MAPVLVLPPTTLPVLVGLEVRERVLEGLRVLVDLELLVIVVAGLGFSSGSPKTIVASETHQMARCEIKLTTDIHGHSVVVSLVRECLHVGAQNMRPGMSKVDI